MLGFDGIDKEACQWHYCGPKKEGTFKKNTTQG